MTKIIGNILFAAAVLFVVLSSCTEERQPCLTPLTSLLKLRTVQMQPGGTVLDTALPAPTMAAITENGIKGYLYPGSAVLTISLSPVADSAMWLFAPDTVAGVAIDTLIFRYEKQLHFISNACGYTHYFNISSVTATHHTIDSIFIINRSVNSDAATNHIQVFIRPAP
jgi:hypothetical protein